MISNEYLETETNYTCFEANLGYKRLYSFTFLEKAPYFIILYYPWLNSHVGYHSVVNYFSFTYYTNSLE